MVFLLVLILIFSVMNVMCSEAIRYGRSQQDEAGECAGNCWCRRESLTCKRLDTLSSIPILESTEERAMITEM